MSAASRVVSFIEDGAGKSGVLDDLQPTLTCPIWSQSRGISQTLKVLFFSRLVLAAANEQNSLIRLSLPRESDPGGPSFARY